MATDGVWHVRHCCPLFFPSAVLPAICPACQRPFGDAVSPVLLPSPFRSAVSHPRTVLIRPTAGEFKDYSGGDLHVGVSDAEGDVIAFDAGGLRRSPAGEWSQCLAIPLPTCDDEGFGGSNSRASATNARKDNVDSNATSKTFTIPSHHKRWDEAIASFLNSTEWTPTTYHETARNCFSFLLAFLERAGCEPFSGPWTREQFARECVLPVSRRAAKYLTLQWRVQRDGWCALEERAGT